MNEMHEFLNANEKPRRKPVKRIIDRSWHPRYEAAHRLNQDMNFPSAVSAGGYIKTTFPDTTKANGLTNAIINFILWHGYRATRISSSGRMVAGKFIPGTTRKGAADISSTIKGRSVMFEIKVGNDRPSDEQLREQELERKAGGEYFFVHSMDEFFKHYDTL